MLDVGCGTGRVTEALLALVPRGRVLALDASADMLTLARRRLGDCAEVWCQDALDLNLDEPVDAILSTATLHWVTDHSRLWARLARALRPGGMLEIQCGGEGNIKRVRHVIEAVARERSPRSSSAGRRASGDGRAARPSTRPAGCTRLGTGPGTSSRCARSRRTPPAGAPHRRSPRWCQSTSAPRLVPPSEIRAAVSPFARA